MPQPHPNTRTLTALPNSAESAVQSTNIAFRARRSAMLALAGSAVLASCVGEPTSLRSRHAGFSNALAFRPIFPKSYDLSSGNTSNSVSLASLVSFSRVRVLFQRISGDVALDTMVVFPSNADSIAVSFSILLSQDAPATGEPLALSLAYVNDPGDTVFRGGPVSVLARAASADATPSIVDVPVAYSGPGAGATSVRIDNHALSVPSGSNFRLSAVALDSTGTVLAGAPIGWRTLDTSLVQVSPNGGGLVQGVRGSARVVAFLLTGQADTSVLAIQVQPTGLQLVSGGGQAAAMGAQLPQQVVVRAVAADGLPVADIDVVFAPTAGGAALPGTARTNSDGYAAASWQLGTAPGPQTLVASVETNPAVELGAQATATSAANVPNPPGGRKQLAFTVEPTDETPGKPFSPALAVQALTGGTPDNSYAGTVTLSLLSTVTGASLSGSASVPAAAGVATFQNLSVGQAGTNYRLVASAPGYAPDTSASFNITAPLTAVVRKLGISGGDAQTGAAGKTLGTSLVVAVVDGLGQPVS